MFLPINHWLKWIKAVVCFLAAGTSLLALSPDRELSQYYLRTWNRQNDLPVNGINAVVQSPDGFIWLGTANGLTRFDGIEFRSAGLDQVPQLRNTQVRALATAGDGQLWVGFVNSGFGRYGASGFTFAGQNQWGGPRLNVRAIIPLRDRSLLIVAQQSVARLSHSGEYTVIRESIGDNFLCGAEDSQGRIWFGTAFHGAYVWDGKTLETFEPLDGRSVQAITQGPDGTFWFATETGITGFDAEFRPTTQIPLEQGAHALLVDRHGVLWIGSTARGLLRYQAGKLDSIDRQRGLAHNQVNALAEDREGSLWVATAGGLNQFIDVKFPTIPVAQDFPIPGAGAVCASKKGGVWIGSHAGLTYYDGNSDTSITYAAEAGVPPGLVKRIYEASNGDVYMVCDLSTLAVFSRGRVVAVHHAPNLVVGLAEDEQGVLASIGGELHRVEPAGFAPYAFSGDKPQFGWILHLLRSKDGSLLVASEVGLFRLKDGAVLEHYGAEQGLRDIRIESLCEQADGTIWCGSHHGIARIKDGRVTNVTRDNGLFDNDTYGMVTDDFGRLWVDSGRGLYRLDVQSVQALADGVSDHVPCVAYDGPEALDQADKTDTQERVACRSLDGKLWFPSAKGVILVDPAHIPANKVPPPVYVERVLADRTPLSLNQSDIAPGSKELEFRFAAPSFVAPQKTSFQYRLIGYEAGWVDAGDRRTAVYTNLQPGNYTFQVRAANADGVWSENEAAVAVQLLPRFYQTSWFVVLCGVVVSATLVGSYLLRVQKFHQKQRSLQRARDELETEVQKRTAELALMNASLIDRTRALENEVEERKRMQQEIERTHRMLVDASRQAGMAEIATNVLHNVGNVLNSVNVSSVLVMDAMKKSSVPGVAKVVALLREHEQDLASFMTSDGRGSKVIRYLAQVSEQLLAENSLALQELVSLRANIEHIKEIVAMQQNYATVGGVREVVDLREIVKHSLGINRDSMERHDVQVVCEFEDVPRLSVDKHKLLQILVNLIGNAKHACVESGRPDKRVTIRLARESRHITISVIDNGVGIPAGNIQRIFNHGFTTREGGHGFGLHSSANAARQMGGEITVHSGGQGEGAMFTLKLPIEAPVPGKTQTATTETDSVRVVSPGLRAT